MRTNHEDLGIAALRPDLLDRVLEHRLSERDRARERRPGGVREAVAARARHRRRRGAVRRVVGLEPRRKPGGLAGGGRGPGVAGLVREEDRLNVALQLLGLLRGLVGLHRPHAGGVHRVRRARHADHLRGDLRVLADAHGGREVHRAGVRAFDRRVRGIGCSEGVRLPLKIGVVRAVAADIRRERSVHHLCLLGFATP